MKSIKNVLALMLALTTFILSSSIATFALDWPWSEKVKIDICEQKNNAGGLYDLGCAYKKADSLIKDGEHYATFDKVGWWADQEIHVFDLSKASEIINKLKPLPNNLSWQEENTLDSKKSNIAAVVAGSIGGGVASFLTIFYNKKGVDLINSREGEKWRPLFWNEILAIVSSAAVACTVIAKVFVGFHFANERSEASCEKKINDSNYISALEQALAFFKNGYWKDTDSISIKFDKDPMHYSASVDFINLGRNYTDAEKEHYIAELKTNVESLLKNN